MRRIRFFRVLLPAALVLFLVLLALSLRQPRSVHGEPTANGQQVEPSATGVRVIGLEGSRKELEFEADEVEQLGNGGYHLEMIRRLLVDQEGKDPLIVQANSADIEGPAESRKIVARDEVRVTDPTNGLVLTLPRLEVDEAAGEARSIGEIVLEEIEGSRGRASQLVYGLAGQPSELYEPVFEHATGARLRAERAVLFDGLNDVELQGGVQAERGEEDFRARRLRIKRDGQDRLRHAKAEGQVAGRVLSSPGVLSHFQADRLEADWDTERELDHVLLQGNASVGQLSESISAERIEALRDGGGELWDVRAEGTVYAQGQFGGGPAWIRSESMTARVDAAFQLYAAEATGNVRVEAPATRAEADRAQFDPADGAGEIRLFATGNRKARVARERTRVAAEQITTDQRGSRLVARRRVEATLLPQAGEGGAAAEGMFKTEQAIHFVASTLESEDAGDHLVFREHVRGWQGERNLSADEIELSRLDTALHARGNVNSRIPREAERAALAEADYVQISADRLDYNGQSRLAVYQGNVRVDLLEGWLESQRVEVRLGDEQGGIAEVLALEDVRIEFREPDAEGTPQLVSGSADRLSYTPADKTVRLFGDDKPASVRRLGAQTASTSGRVLRYRLDLGTLEVESGEQAPARIRGR